MESYMSTTDEPESNVTLEELVTPTELANALKVPVSWVYGHSRCRGRQRIPCIKVGKYLRFSLSEVERWLATLRER